jgi:hypothetical protein
LLPVSSPIGIFISPSSLSRGRSAVAHVQPAAFLCLSVTRGWGVYKCGSRGWGLGRQRSSFTYWGCESNCAGGDCGISLGLDRLYGLRWCGCWCCGCKYLFCSVHPLGFARVSGLRDGQIPVQDFILEFDDIWVIVQVYVIWYCSYDHRRGYDSIPHFSFPFQQSWGALLVRSGVFTASHIVMTELYLFPTCKP